MLPTDTVDCPSPSRDDIPISERRSRTYVPDVIVVVAAGPTSPHQSETLRRVLIVDRNRLAALALAKLLRIALPEIEVATCDEVPPDWSDTDLMLLKIDAQQSRLEIPPDLAGPGERSTPVVMVAEELDSTLLLRALEAGVTGILTTDATASEFIEAVQTAHRGHLAISRVAFDFLLERALGPAVPQRVFASQLSPTELSVLVMLAEAKSVRTIAAHRGVSPKTIRNHLAHVYKKLDVNSRTEAILYAVSRGLVNAGSA